MLKRHLTSLLFLFLGSGWTAAAQQDTAANVLDEIIVTSRRKAGANINTPGSTQSLSETYLDNYQPRTIPEALTGLNGVLVQKTNHGGGSPFIRGLTGNQTLILVDGIRLNNSTFRYGPNQYLNTIDPFTVRKIEVAKGTGSVQYGSDAMGGVLQVFTKEPQFTGGRAQWSGCASGRYMTGGMEETVRGEAVYGAQKVAAAIGATYRNFGDLTGGDTTGKQSPSGYREFSFDVKSKFQLEPKVLLTLAHQFLKQNGVPVYHKVILENFALNEFDPQLRMLDYAKLNIAKNSRWMNALEMIASFQQSIEGRSSRKNGSSLLRRERDVVGTLGFTTDISSLFSDVWSANSGIELYRDRVRSTREDQHAASGAKSILRGLYPDHSRYGNYSVYSLHHLSFTRWMAEAGLRYNIFEVRIRDTTLGKVKITPSSFVWNASLLYKLRPGQSLFVSFNTGYRAPNVDDMGTLGIVDFRYEIPAYDLGPEKSRNIELGYKLQSARWTAGLSGYYMQLRDLITRMKTDGEAIGGYPVYKKQNVEEGFIKGWEAEAGYRPVTGWHLKGNIAYTFGQSFTKNEPLRRMPPLNGRLMSSYTRKGWFGSAELLFASKQGRLAQGDKEDNRIPTGGTPGWKVLNFFAGYEQARWKCHLGVQNIFNADYRTHGSGINGVGRSGWLSLTIHLPPQKRVTLRKQVYSPAGSTDKRFQ